MSCPPSLAGRELEHVLSLSKWVGECLHRQHSCPVATFTHTQTLSLGERGDRHLRCAAPATPPVPPIKSRQPQSRLQPVPTGLQILRRRPPGPGGLSSQIRSRTPRHRSPVLSFRRGRSAVDDQKGSRTLTVVESRSSSRPLLLRLSHNIYPCCREPRSVRQPDRSPSPKRVRPAQYFRPGPSV